MLECRYCFIYYMGFLCGFSEQGLMNPEISEVQDLVRRLGGELIGASLGEESHA